MPDENNSEKSAADLHILQDRRVSIYMGKIGPLSEAERNRCIVQYMELVAPVAHKYRGGSAEWDELLAAGREGLVLAARSFNPALGDFRPRALQFIDNKIRDFLRASKSQWLPKESDEPLPPVEGDKIERIYEWDAWGVFGNGIAICEAWTVAGATPEEIALAYDEVKHRKERFAAAFISLSEIQRKMIRFCFMTDPRRTIESAAREIGISRYRASRSLKKALVVMREVIANIEKNERAKVSVVA